MKKTKMTPTFKIAKKRMIASKKAPARRMKARAAKEKKRTWKMTSTKRRSTRMKSQPSPPTGCSTRRIGGGSERQVTVEKLSLELAFGYHIHKLIQRIHFYIQI